ncbi:MULTISPECIES: nucleoside-diphosphate sugar epimerase/dehydratase [Clostridium]|uniref:Capsular polysaccharide biosynthesis protein n=1 Tax=Clostridium botulinum (strain Eklund 17B / Type B) TaxID=935198 RepID=B2TQB5_CLOBB|nr:MULTISPECIES: nucleoside-diphosphate sugar epimerase/dehydratase [Clostridium]ACD22618.1 capsular polysaccharide biosynthesis protein [Clostridium botulinum B str. Eklund 17B (NRP)]MBN1046618.1 polysaccharide biosynthesis protein [Clostridium botulinum]MBN1053309.1 polysaccharide biosynthesis protein [Clostridium botulinum]MBY6975552.1 polysaccharide biosynthesis protein [Clostridium botulinum]MBY7001101.1 polysaccharide biosynthesis protein [Clostridium botulinum]
MRNWKTLIIMIIDIFMVNMAYLFAINITLSGRFTEIAKIYTEDVIAVSLIYLVCFYLFKMYESLWHLTGTDEFLLGVGGSILAGILSIGYTRFWGSVIPLNVSVVGILLSIFFVLGYRILYRVYRRTLLYIPFKYSSDQRRVMIVGAGSAGTMIINEMMARRELKYNPIVLIDDDKEKLGRRISGVKIVGNRYDIPYVVGEQEIDLILISIPSLDSKNKAEIIDICKKTNCKLQIIPGIYEILSGDANVSRIKDVDLEDLLGRDPIVLDNKGISDYIQGKTILVTGAGGSIGSELCRQISVYNPKRLILFDIYENNIYDIQNELKEEFPDMNLTVLIGSIRDRQRLHEVFSKYKINVVFHAAAHKHVPLMEDSPKEAVKNNVFGTLNLATEASKAKIDRFVMISTDKAVNPTNIMGATKRLCEMIVQAMDKQSKTEFVAVRFGNVLGSNGSVIPLFKKQIANGGPVTLTHKKIVRYFMLIPEAAQLVLQAGAFAKGGEVFVLDMGKPVKIYDLACDLIRLSGFEPNRDIKIVVTGLRPGEKLYEELLMSEEGLKDTAHQKIYVGKPTFEDMDTLNYKLEQLRKLLELNDINEIKHQMQTIVPTYHYKNEDEVAAENADKE